MIGPRTLPDGVAGAWIGRQRLRCAAQRRSRRAAGQARQGFDNPLDAWRINGHNGQHETSKLQQVCKSEVHGRG